MLPRPGVLVNKIAFFLDSGQKKKYDGKVILNFIHLQQFTLGNLVSAVTILSAEECKKSISKPTW